MDRTAYSSCCLECMHACTVTEGGSEKRETMEGERERERETEKRRGRRGSVNHTLYVT